jgi:N-acetyl-anhydromuramyl-L-alanine amidase AmpD
MADSQIIDFAAVQVLHPEEKLVVLTNMSQIPAEFTTHLVFAHYYVMLIYKTVNYFQLLSKSRVSMAVLVTACSFRCYVVLAMH